MNTSEKGKKGEDCAVRFLEQQGYEIVDRNYRGYRGEIDIVARENETIVFVEVKTWDSFGVDELEYAINKEKQARIEKTAKHYLHVHDEFRELVVRFDVIFLSSENGVEEHWSGVFNGA